MAVVSAKGTTVSYNSQTVGGVISFSGFDGAAADKDRTTLASTAKEYAPGLQDNGEFTLDLFRDGDDAGQAAILTALSAQSTNTMVVTLPTSTLNVATFSAYVKSLSSVGAVDEDVKGKVAFKITGAVTWS